jgi:tetratricopeptide (TPR) repeat protein
MTLRLLTSIAIIIISTSSCDSFVLKSKFKIKEAEKNFEKAQEHEMNGELDKAISHYDKAHQLSPENPMILHARGLVKSNMKKYESSIIDLNKSIELTEENDLKEIRIGNRALTYMQMGNMENACQDWKKCNAINYIKKYCK